MEWRGDVAADDVADAVDDGVEVAGRAGGEVALTSMEGFVRGERKDAQGCK